MWNTGRQFFKASSNKYNGSESAYVLWTHHGWHLSTCFDRNIICLCHPLFFLYQLVPDTKKTQQFQRPPLLGAQLHIAKTPPLRFPRWRWPNKSPTGPWPRWMCKHKENMPRWAMLEAGTRLGGWVDVSPFKGGLVGVGLVGYATLELVKLLLFGSYGRTFPRKKVMFLKM